VEHGFDLIASNRMTDGVIVPDIARDEGPPAHEAFMPGGKIVQDDRRVARAVERLAGMRTDIARTTGDEDGTRTHSPISSLSVFA
jgi:hypothetical protein